MDWSPRVIHATVHLLLLPHMTAQNVPRPLAQLLPVASGLPCLQYLLLLFLFPPPHIASTTLFHEDTDLCQISSLLHP